MKNLNISKYFIIIFVLSLFSIPIFSINANAGVYPDRPISIAACYPPGGGVDRNLRMVERVASKYLDQSLLPQYVTGGSGTVAMQYITAADPDGYDLAICDNGGAIIAPIAQGLDLGASDFTPIAQVSFVPWIMTAGADSGFNSMDDFTDQPKIINGASDIIAKIFDKKGEHTRAAVSVNSLPLGVAVEVDAIFELN